MDGGLQKINNIKTGTDNDSYVKLSPHSLNI